MKNIALALSVILVTMFGMNTFAQQGLPVVGLEKGPVITIDKELHDYGVVEYGADGVCVFTITNTGNAPLIISMCEGSCGCTVPECPKTPIAPGASAEITVSYDTERSGPFAKSVTIKSNALNTPLVTLKIKGSVKAKPVSEASPETN